MSTDNDVSNDGDNVPPPRKLGHIKNIDDPTLSPPTVVQKAFIGTGCPPVPIKLIRKTESGTFTEMTKLFPEWLGVLCTDDDAKLKPKK